MLRCFNGLNQESKKKIIGLIHFCFHIPTGDLYKRLDYKSFQKREEERLNERQDILCVLRLLLGDATRRSKCKLY